VSLRFCGFDDFGDEFGTGPIFAFENSLEAAIGIDDGRPHIMSYTARGIVPEGQAEEVAKG